LKRLFGSSSPLNQAASRFVGQSAMTRLRRAWAGGPRQKSGFPARRSDLAVGVLVLRVPSNRDSDMMPALRELIVLALLAGVGCGLALVRGASPRRRLGTSDRLGFAPRRLLLRGNRWRPPTIGRARARTRRIGTERGRRTCRRTASRKCRRIRADRADHRAPARAAAGKLERPTLSRVLDRAPPTRSCAGRLRIFTRASRCGARGRHYASPMVDDGLRRVACRAPMKGFHIHLRL
jgi:hypothetical protein